MSDPADRALLTAIDGDPAAFERFVALTVAKVTRYCRYLGDPDQIDDVVQDTYLRAFASMHSFRGDSPAEHWLLVIARRASAEAIKHNARARRPELTRRPTTDEQATAVIELLIADLPFDQRRAFVLTQLIGYTYDEAAHFCGCPVGTIRSRVARARANLTAAFETSKATG